MTVNADETNLVVVSAASVRCAIRGLETKVVPQPKAQQMLSDEQKAAIFARLGEAMRSIDEVSRGMPPQMLVAPSDRVASIFQSKIAEEKKGQLISLGPGQGYEIKFEEPDDWLGWGLSVLEWIHLKNHQQVPPRPGMIHAMPEEARLTIVGDWGTGMYGAPRTAQTIARLSGSYFMQLHLGDIYYSGTPTEVKTRFLRVWKRRGEAISRSLNGNHEMYSGGYGYFDAIMEAFQQPSSYFAHQNEGWLLVALDTAYVDHNMADDQIEWLKQLIANAGQRKVVLFSHHQPFSTLDGGGENLVKTMQSLLNSRRITYWYWGHEHRCIWYDAHPQWSFRGRCIGHGGIPYHRAPVADKPWVGDDTFGWRRLREKEGIPACHVLDGPNTYVDKKYDPEKFGPQGFVTLHFNGDQLAEEVFLPDGHRVALPPLLQ
jgi:hypothetical protein